MYQTNKYLTFRLHESLYGIEAEFIQEIFPLPELLPIADVRCDIIGVFYLKQQLIPVLHLDSLLGSSLKECHISDYIILIQWESLPIGIVVPEICEMIEIDNEIIENAGFPENLSINDISFVTGVIQVDSEKIWLLNSQKLIRYPDSLLTLIWDLESELYARKKALEEQNYLENYQLLEGIQIPSFYALYCPHTTLEERKIFQQRASELQNIAVDSETDIENISLAVIAFGDKYFGLDLELVREFISIQNLKPIPCCPKHIIGNMNLRGQIITLVDIRNVLNLPTTPINIGSKAVVFQVNDILASFPVDRVLEVVSLKQDKMMPLSVTSFDDRVQYLRGIAPFGEQVLLVLDLPKILTEGGLIVNDRI
ncbi:chemotaxis protein CheW [Scytonema sp. UIC 10036]|uniref:chemotaxis protein CheW n=1 Tax=Scytonema sp. UIC 10036 TaxID=2304196 RepID=UPI0012DAB7C6|nr:chemotaxis protein CheW [Scytonema sp. UIC 10036]MUG98213.1 chemotaxis protein CheW [Scytonema sp. UIC 10036]